MNNAEITTLYKYKPLNQFTLDIIANERIFYPLPESFNDPFDTQCSFRSTSKIVQSMDVRKIEAAFPGQSANSISAYTKRDLTPKIEQFRSRLKGHGILSLSENDKDILMWAHYADDHKGICIGFCRDKDNKLGNSDVTKKVVYTKNYPSLNAGVLLSESNSESSFQRVLCTKSEQWKYENEWRTFMPNGGQVFSVPGEIETIAFGVRSTEMDVDIIRKLVAGKNVDLYKAELKVSEFGIKLNKIT